MYEAMIGDRNAARSDLNRALLAPSANNSDVFFKAAVIYKQAGNSEQALTYLQKCVAAGFSPNRIRDNPVFDDLASEPRLQALTRK
jgi:tetratricopeptide (TPR) repeat protein